MGGVNESHDGMVFTPRSAGSLSASLGAAPRRRVLTVQDYIDGVLSCDRTILSRAITLVESNSPAHFETAQQVISGVLNEAQGGTDSLKPPKATGSSVRVGITGVPGAGKSTFIEALGTWLCENGHRVAVLAVDPSSSVTKGSILGDKTRMEKLSRNKNAFIRPSPSGGTLGGLTRKSRETMLLCEAAGYDVILVETVGVGQSEVTVRDMVDFFMLLVITGAGDELQGMKKGVMELADAIVVNKADGDNVMKARTTRVDYDRFLHYLRPSTEGWVSHAYACSSVTNEGVPEIWDVITEFMNTVKASGVFAERRKQQSLSWVRAMLEDHLLRSFYENPAVKAHMPEAEERVARGELAATQAALELLSLYTKQKQG
ncbi:MAG: methylmalonyl Co-A mutase-associated GTPase MeaB [Fretibacterium sp.]|nr:methylmalonyl Co-A mutase-associated GTPase MeaB [Fretibacterium sp.]